MSIISGSDMARAEKCAERLNTFIPGHQSIYTWVLPLIEALLDRIEALEKQVKK